MSDINVYFKWMNQQYEYQARQPAIDYKEFYIWQTYQIQTIESGLYPVNNYDWYEIRETLINNKTSL